MLLRAGTDSIRSVSQKFQIQCLSNGVHGKRAKLIGAPIFHPEYVACVDRVRDDVRVGLIFDDAQELVGIFPYQGNRNCLAEPVGGAINDYHGVIGAGNLKLTQEEIVRLTGASKFQFHAWLDPDESMERYVYGPDQAYVADLSAGAEPFIKEISNQSVAVKRHGQKSRKMMREIGSLRLEIDSKDKDLLDWTCLLYTSPSPRDRTRSRMPSSA